MDRERERERVGKGERGLAVSKQFARVISGNYPKRGEGQSSTETAETDVAKGAS